MHAQQRRTTQSTTFTVIKRIQRYSALLCMFAPWRCMRVCMCSVCASVCMWGVNRDSAPTALWEELAQQEDCGGWWQDRLQLLHIATGLETKRDRDLSSTTTKSVL
jgi:hypothetical protein